MANQSEIEAVYDWVDHFHTLRLGAYADFTCAYFNGDFSKTLDQAQKNKHAWILKGVSFQAGQRILDIGCGWGNMLQAVRLRDGMGLGLTLSSAQTQYGQAHGLDVRLQDWKTVDRNRLGKFDGVVSIGAFEHFCSIEEFEAGQQEKIYDDFFRLCADVLPDGGRLYLQTMIWGHKVPDPKTLKPDAPEGSVERSLARMLKFYPGSWLPQGKHQIVDMAAKYFYFLESSNGRLDYIETLKRWDASTRNLYHPKRFWRALIGAFRLVPRYLSDPDFRVQIESVKKKDQQVCFEREIITHERLFFQKK
ncbi:MAG: class I SAM-dependent methyltransferase [Candidatus Kerfeldbacteria bacterium]|nr:class I SAM-dependent methyltransferase [Candidatus Kerfeldbacteria bacterium]